jgi:hypothetical protein
VEACSGVVAEERTAEVSPLSRWVLVHHSSYGGQLWFEGEAGLVVITILSIVSFD